MAIFIDGKQARGSLIVEGDLTMPLPTIDTASGSVATFDTDLTENLIEVKCQIVAKQSGSGTPSPSNPRPITTYTEMNVWRGNNNLLPNTATTQTINDVTFTVNADKSITVNGLASADTNFVINQTTEIKKSGNYILKGCPQYGSSTTYYMRSTRGLVVSDTGSGSYPTAYNMGDSVYLFIHIHGGYNADNLVFKPMIIHENETDTSYHAYNGTTANIPFGQTVAKGVLDVTTGKLRVTHWVVDMGSLTLTKGGNNHFADLPKTIKQTSSAGETANIACEIFATAPQTSYSQNNNQITYYYTGSTEALSRIIVYSTDYADLTSFETAITGYKMMWELATPIEIQLDSITLQALLNENNIWCDTGDTSVKFLLTVGKKIS